MKNELARLQMEVLEQIRPKQDERERLQRVTRHVIAEARSALERRNLRPTVEVIGSAARDTWISGDRDIDIFIGFDTSTSREELERHGLEIGKEIAVDGYTIGFAEHPYVKARCGGFDIDIVPYYRIENTRQIFSAVDRTPFHQRFVAEHLDGRHDDVRLLKKFLKGTGIYGAELRTKGFSGYLCELLIIKFGSFVNVLQHVQDWKVGTCISLTSTHARNRFASPLAVIDPVDTSRNVAAAVSLDSLSIFLDSARSFLERPCIDYFFPPPIVPLDAGALRDFVCKRKTTVFGVKFDLPDLVDDIAYPQLERAHKGMLVALLRHGFSVLRGDIYYDQGEAVLLFEMLVSQLPAAKRHEGPPVDSKEHGNKFKKKYTNNPVVLSGPYIDDGRYVVELRRKYLTLPEYITAEFKNVRSSKAIVRAMEKGFRVLKDEELLFSEKMGLFLARYFHKTLSNCDRITVPSSRTAP